MTTIAEARRFRIGNFIFDDNSTLSPRKLPRHKQVPISGTINAALRTADGSHPPALGALDIELDRALRINARGLPSCKRRKLENRTTPAARRACRRAIVGSGRGTIEVAFPDQTPFTATSPITIFNGGVRGHTTYQFAHAFAEVPAPTAIVVPVKIRRIHRGRFGINAVAKIPRITGGYGSVTSYKFTIRRKFTYKSRKKSYLTGTCPTGRIYGRGELRFADGSRLQISNSVSCVPKQRRSTRRRAR